MLLLLLRTRLRYYRNYLRHHFDRMVWLEIGFIILLLFYLAGRFPADIGYSFNFLQQKDFPLRYATQWIALLPGFYLFAEALAFMTLRPTGEWQIIGALPIAKPNITNYHLLRHGSKTLALLFMGTAPFLFGDDDIVAKLARGLLAFSLLLALQLLGFMQARRLLNTGLKLSQRILRWLPLETVILAGIVMSTTPLKEILINSSNAISLGWLAGGSFAILLLFYLRRNYEPGVVENQVSFRRKAIRATTVLNQLNRLDSATSAMIWRDLKFLWAEKRAAFILVVFATIIILLAALAQSSAAEAYASSIVLEGIFGFMLINTLLVLFEQDAKAAALQRSLPVSAPACWKARWLLATGFMIMPAIGTVLVIPFVCSVEIGFVFFLGLALIIPAIFSAVFCNAGFGLFPNIKFCSVLLNILLSLMILFWFYMPLGTVILLAISALWIRKSQRHFQLLEIG